MMHSNLIRVSISTVALAWLAGCGSPSAAENCQSIATAQCERAFECLTPGELAEGGFGVDIGDCRIRTRAVLGCSAPASTYCPPGTEFDNGAAEACASDIASLTCGALRDGVAASSCERVCVGDFTPGPDAGPAQPQCSPDSRESNDGLTSATAITGSTTLSDLSLCEGDVDIFVVNAQFSGFDLVVAATGGPIDITIRNEANTVLFSGTNSVEARNLPAQAYYIRLASTEVLPNYTLTVSPE
ncbi:MAG: hypothetical protein KJO07_22010 [Deltaproteobacteria bacterium]|nr:hypothetical protein [Deltaproteobacteria bacterium]